MSLLLLGASAALIALALLLSRLREPKPMSRWLLYTTRAYGGYTVINRVGPVPSAPQRLNANFVDVWFLRWSPDGQWIAFFASGEVKAGRVIPDYNQYTLYRMRPDGRDVQPLLHDWVGTPINLVWSPDGKTLTWDAFIGQAVGFERFARSANTYQSTTFQIDVDSGTVKQQATDGEPWKPAADIDWTRGNMWPSRGLLPKDVRPGSSAPPLAQSETWLVYPIFDVNPPGLYRVPTAQDGPPELLFALRGQLISVSSSPDGRYIAVSTLEPGGGKMYRIDITRGQVTQLIHDANAYHVMSLSWSPDSRWIAVEAHSKYSGGVYLLPADSTALLTVDQLTRLVDGTQQNDNLSWSPPSNLPPHWGWLLGTGVVSITCALLVWRAKP